MEDAELVFQRTLANKARNYPGAADSRSSGGKIFPSFAPGFEIPKGSSVFTIGSCFARNVERALLGRDIVVPTADYSAPSDEAPGQPNRILNQYNPATMLQCVQAAGQDPSEVALYDAPGGKGVIDPLLATGTRPVSRARALERRAEISALYRDGLAASDTVVITLGLIEAWFEAQSGHYLNEAPMRRVLKDHPGRWTFHRMSVETCRGMVQALVEAVRAPRQR
ncbi:MAG: GSCFA domain-containing protein, partial [Pseudomonadota bacterium]